jgi:hypothetical protein
MITLRQSANAFTFSTGALASVLFASNSGHEQLAYILFTMSSLVAIALLWKDLEQRGLLWLNGFYCIVNVFGLCRWFHVF